MAELSTFSETTAPVESNTPPVLETAAPTPSPSESTPPQENITPTEQDESSSAFAIDLGDEGSAAVQEPSYQAPQFNWKEEIKKLPKDELIAELGLDPFTVEIERHIKNGGQPIDYLQARGVDYNKFTDEGLVKDSLRKENPNLSPSQIDLLYNRKYHTTEDATDEDKEFVSTLLQSDAYKIRQARIAEQQKFKVPDTPIPQKNEAYEQWERNRQAQAQNVEALRNFFETHAATKALNESKRVTVSLGDGVAPFNFVIDKPEVINRVLTDDGTTWNKLTSTPQGEPDIAKQQLLSLVAINPQKVFQDIFNYGVQMGERKRVAEGQNASRQPARLAQMTGNDKATYRTGTFGKPN